MLRIFQKNIPVNNKNLMSYSSKYIVAACKKNSVYFYVGILSAVIFCSIYGWHVLNPTYVDWLFNGGDLTQHYLGWEAYRYNDWHFPLGMLDTLAYPNRTSIIFTDSIPLFAFIFKLLSPILPENFQYFGLWGIMCFVMSGIFSVRILKNFTDNKTAVILSSLLFVYTPVMIHRMFLHTSLAGHWIILLGLEPIFVYDKYKENKKIYLIVGIMGLLSASVHLYFVLMSGIILIGICLSDIMNSKRIRRSILLLFDYLVMVVGVVWLLGGFNSGVQAGESDLGAFSLNLNAFFNPQGYSCIYKELPLYDNRQYEGFAYMGAGCIFCLFIALISFIGHNRIINYWQKYRREILSLVTICIIVTIVAISPTVTFNENVIAELKLCDFIIKGWSVFRASGRMVWVAIYIVMLCSFIILYKTMKGKTLFFAVVMVLILQVYDIHDVLVDKNNRFNQIMTYESVLENKEFWDYLSENDEIEHVVYGTPINVTHEKLSHIFGLTEWTLKNQKTISDFYFARGNSDAVDISREEALTNLSQDTVFVFWESDRLECLKYNLNYYEIDEMIIGYKDEIDGFTQLSNSDFYRNWTFGNNMYLDVSCGADTENGRELYSEGMSYGPYWRVPSGKYSIIISGKEVDESTITVYSQSGAEHHNYTTVFQTEEKLVLDFELETDVNDLEICVINNSEETILLKGIKLIYAD